MSIAECRAQNTIRLAQSVARGSSGDVCLVDALAAFGRGDYEHAHTRALKSIAYRVGMSSPVYAQALAVVQS